MDDSYLAKFRNILQLAHRYHRKFKPDNYTPSVELSIMQKHVIHYILSHGNQGVYQKDIEKFFLISRSTASTMVKSLEAKGIIVKKKSEKDARLRELVVVSPYKEEFQVVYDQMKESMENLLEQMVRDIDKSDMEVFDKVLAKIQENLTNRGEQ